MLLIAGSARVFASAIEPRLALCPPALGLRLLVRHLASVSAAYPD